MGSDTWTVRVKVPSQGCTLSPGYWKTHSSYGPARFDGRWAAVLRAAGQDTPYIAAQLNKGIVGSFPPAVQTAFDEATTLFNTYTPAQVAALKSKHPVRKQFLSLATTLANFNSGVTGPGHCTE